MTSGVENDSAESTPGSLSKIPAQKQSFWILSLVFLATIALAARLLTLISRYAANVFFMDQWDFNDATLFQPHSLWEMFRWQHGPHRQGLGAVISFLIEPHFHWNSRCESFLAGAMVILAALCALWLKQRLFGALTVFDVCIPVIFLSTSVRNAVHHRKCRSRPATGPADCSVLPRVDRHKSSAAL